MTSLVGVFDTRADAEKAVVDLVEAGISRSAITYVGTQERAAAADATEPPAESATVTGMGLGAFAGGALGALVGIGILAFPAIGPIVAAGALGSAIAGGAVGAATGIAAGGLAGALADVGGVSPERAERYEQSISKGGGVVFVEAGASSADTVTNILRRNGAADVHPREPGEPVPSAPAVPPPAA